MSNRLCFRCYDSVPPAARFCRQCGHDLADPDVVSIKRGGSRPWWVIWLALSAWLFYAGNIDTNSSTGECVTPRCHGLVFDFPPDFPVNHF